MIGTTTDKRLRELLKVARAYAERSASLTQVEAALCDADRAAVEASECARAEVWSIFEALRVGDAVALARDARTVTAAIRWALGTSETPPPIPKDWAWAKKCLADSTFAPVCKTTWRTPDVLALAQFVQSGGTDALPILADALQDAGCEDDVVLDHCRSDCLHSRVCWVPNWIIDNE